MFCLALKTLGAWAVNPENPSGSCLTRKKENINGCYFWGQVDHRRWEWCVIDWMFVSPQNLYAKSLIPKVMVSLRWGLWKVIRARWHFYKVIGLDRIRAFLRRDSGELALSPCVCLHKGEVMWVCSRKAAIRKPRTDFSLETNASSTLTSNFQPLEVWENKFLLSKPFSLRAILWTSLSFISVGGWWIILTHFGNRMWFLKAFFFSFNQRTQYWCWP